MDLSAMIFGLPRAVFPVLAATTFHTNAQGLGYLYAAPGVGAVLAALSSGWLSRSGRLGRVVVVSVAVWGVAIIAFGFATALWVGLLCLAVAGAADAISAVCRNAIQQTLTPDELRGRLTATYVMVVVGGPFIGDFEAGLVQESRQRGSQWCPAACSRWSVWWRPPSPFPRCGITAVAPPMPRRRWPTTQSPVLPCKVPVHRADWRGSP
jgi:MFS family permease